MYTTTAMTIGPCSAGRHSVCGPADAFPPKCEACMREELETDAARYRYLRDHLGLGFAVYTGERESVAGPTLLDMAVDAAMKRRS